MNQNKYLSLDVQQKYVVLSKIPLSKQELSFLEEQARGFFTWVCDQAQTTENLAFPVPEKDRDLKYVYFLNCKELAPDARHGLSNSLSRRIVIIPEYIYNALSKNNKP